MAASLKAFAYRLSRRSTYDEKAATTGRHFMDYLVAYGGRNPALGDRQNHTPSPHHRLAPREWRVAERGSPAAVVNAVVDALSTWVEAQRMPIHTLEVCEHSERRKGLHRLTWRSRF